jgi:ankyrin repeat protein
VDSLSDERAQTEYKLMLKTKTLLHSIEIGNAELAKSLIDELQDARLLVKSTGFAIQDISGNGILQIAAMRNRLDMVKLLISRGFDINNVDRNHGTALQVSLYLDHSRITKYLLDPASISLDIAAVRTNDSNTQTSKIDVNVSGGLYGTALQVAAYKGSKKWIQELLGKGANAMIRCGKYGSVLQAAARTGLPNVVELILDEDIDPNWQGGSYSTALQACAKGAYTTRTTYVRNLAHGRILNQDAPNQVLRAPSSEKPDYTKVATMLIAKGARVNSGGGKYGSPMNAAASSGNIEMVKLLLREDRSTEKEHQHAYDCALLSAITQTFSTSRLELVEQLVDNKADISFEAGSGLYNRPFMAAAAMNDSKVLEYLWKKAQTLDIGPIYLNAQSGIYGTALRAALSKRAKDTAKLLIGWGADLMSCDPSYGNVLHLATFSGMEDIVELLLKKNIDVNIQDNCQQTPLHIAAYFARTSIAQVLLNNRANTELRDAWDMTPLDIVDQVMHRESHPGPSLDDLRQMKQLLVTKRSTETVPSDELTFKGPRIIKPHASVNKTPEELLSCPEKGKPTGKARSVYSSPIWNPGLSFKADIIDFLVKDDEEYVKMERIKIDDLLYRESVLDEVMKTECVENGTVSKQDNKLKLSVRWIHLPSNNVSKVGCTTQKYC